MKYRLTEGDGELVGDFKTLEEARSLAERRARERAHGLTWSDFHKGRSRGSADPSGMGCLDCVIEKLGG